MVSVEEFENLKKISKISKVDKIEKLFEYSSWLCQKFRELFINAPLN